MNRGKIKGKKKIAKAVARDTTPETLKETDIPNRYRSNIFYHENDGA